MTKYSLNFHGIKAKNRPSSFISLSFGFSPMMRRSSSSPKSFTSRWKSLTLEGSSLRAVLKPDWMEFEFLGMFEDGWSFRTWKLSDSCLHKACVQRSSWELRIIFWEAARADDLRNLLSQIWSARYFGERDSETDALWAASRWFCAVHLGMLKSIFCKARLTCTRVNWCVILI